MKQKSVIATKLALKALATNRIKGSVTAFKTYPLLDGGILGCTTDSAYWFINDNGEKQFAYKEDVLDGLSDPKKQYSFELVLAACEGLEKEIAKNAKAAIADAYRPGGDIWMSSKFGTEWLGKLNAAHQVDCQKYEGIIENLMDAFGVNTYDELAKFASNLKKSADIIDAIRKK